MNGPKYFAECKGYTVLKDYKQDRYGFDRGVLALTPDGVLVKIEWPSSETVIETDPFLAAEEAYKYQKFDEALKLYHKLAAEGNHRAMVKLGRIHESGNLLPLEPAKAAKWYRKAIEVGSTNAKYYLACLYREGQAVAKDDQKSTELLRQAAREGHGGAARALADFRESSEGRSMTPEEEFAWFKSAYEKGDKKALFHLAEHFSDGHGNHPNPDEVERWWDEEVSDWDKLDIGDHFLKSDSERSKGWYQRVIDSGDQSCRKHALRGLARMYQGGEREAADREKALHYYRQAAEEGDDIDQHIYKVVKNDAYRAASRFKRMRYRLSDLWDSPDKLQGLKLQGFMFFGSIILIIVGFNLHDDDVKGGEIGPTVCFVLSHICVWVYHWAGKHMLRSRPGSDPANAVALWGLFTFFFVVMSVLEWFGIKL